MARRALDCYDGPTVRGIDVSRWQSQIRWDRIPADIRFAFIRLSAGARTLDTRFVENWRNCGQTTMVRGLYQAIRLSSGDGVAHARFLIDHLKAQGGLRAGDFPPVLDIERMDDRTPEELVRESARWVEVIQSELGRQPIIYTGSFWHWKIAIPKPDLAGVLGGLPLWTPDYTARGNRICAGVPKGWDFWSIWQYSSHGDLPGIPGRVDLNHYRGDESSLKSFVQTSHISPPPGVSPSPKC